LPDASWDAVIVIADSVYVRIVAIPPTIDIALLRHEKEYDPSLLLTPFITASSENETSVLYVFVICEMDWYVGAIAETTSEADTVDPPV
jgi:hypothetical protein